MDSAEELAFLMELQGEQAGADDLPSTSGMSVEPTPSQSKAITSLLSRGRTAGWLVDPAEASLA